MSETKTLKEKIEEQIDWLIQNEVFCTATWCMSDLLRYAEEHPSEAVIDIEDYWSQLDVCPECGSPHFETFGKVEDYIKENPDFNVKEYNEENPNYRIQEDEYYSYRCSDCGTIFDYSETADVMEYWFVSKWIANKLRDKGEIVLDTYIPIWCRCATGQALKLDGCWYEIAKDIVEYRKQYERPNAD